MAVPGVHLREFFILALARLRPSGFSEAVVTKAAPHLKVIETVDIMSKMAAKIGNLRTTTVLARAREQAVRRSRACELRDSEVELCLKSFMMSRRQTEERTRAALQRLRAQRKSSQEAKAAADETEQELRKQKLALAAERLKAAKQDEVKYFSAQMCGAGRENGGTKEHKANRMEFLERVRKQFPPLSEERAVQYEDFKARLECRLPSYIGMGGKGYGQWFKFEMDAILDQKKKGDFGAFYRWIRTTSMDYKTVLDAVTKV